MVEEKDIRQKAISYARKNRKQIAKKVLENYSRVEYPYSMFMAGSPGAGKTEWAKNVSQVTSGEILHIERRIRTTTMSRFQIITSIKKFLHLGQKSPRPTLDYLMNDATQEERMEVFREAAILANQEQRDNMKRWEKMKKKSA